MSDMAIKSSHAEPPPSLGLNNEKLGMWIFLASEVMFFTSLIAALLAFRSRTPVGYGEFKEFLNIPLTAVNTFILLVSSFTVVKALASIQDDDHSKFRLYLLASLALGSTFVGVQAIEWLTLFGEGVTPDGDIFGTAFFVLTGFHGLHVIVGLIWMLFVLGFALLGRYTPHNNMGIEVFGLYWHFVDVVWIFLFTIIYLL